MSASSTSFAPRAGEQAFANAGRTALVVEDDLASALALKAVLERALFNVVPAADGRTALDALDGDGGRAIGVVVMDIKMPVMNGYEAMAAIRDRPRFARLPIIAVSAKGNDDERERCLAAGASDFVAKPIDVADLLGAIDMWIQPPDASVGPNAD